MIFVRSALLLLVACAFPSKSDRYSCETNADCEAGRICDERGFCVRSDAQLPADAAGDSSSDSVADAPQVLPRTCREAFQGGVVTDGVVTIDLDGAGAGPAFHVYCDMTTAGGGWTLVWSYGFTNYGNFTNSNNAVTPRPTWGYASSSGTPTSTTIPTSPTMLGAIDFARWKDVGTEILVTSTINHWIRCVPGTGSLVTQTQGSLTCSVVRVVPNECTTVAPSLLVTDNQGPTLARGNIQNKYYYFDGSTQSNWPTHDPCGDNSSNHVGGLADPRGAIYVRAL